MFRPFRPWGLGGNRFLGLRAWRFTPGCHILGFQPRDEEDERGKEDRGRRAAGQRGGVSVLRCSV
jgi:hypothetical protein